MEQSHEFALVEESVFGKGTVTVKMERALSTCCYNVCMGFFTIGCILFCRPCLADDKARAKDKFMEGMGFVEQENYLAALSAFQESYGIRRKASVLFNIAMCFKALYRYIESIETFRQYLAEEKSGKIRPARRQKVEESIAEIEKLVGKLRLDGAPNDADVIIDGEKYTTTPLDEPLLMNPGKYNFELRKEGHEPLVTEFTIASGAVTPLRVRMSERSEEEDPAPPPVEARVRKVEEEKDHDGFNWILAVGVASAVAGAAVAGGVGGYFAYDANNHHGDWSSAAETGDKEMFDSEKKGFKDAYRNMIIGYSVGGALVVTGIVLIAVGAGQQDGSERAAVLSGPNGFMVTF